MTFDRIRGGDHTFTRSEHRRALIERLLRILDPEAS
jgi:hypothetical protein